MKRTILVLYLVAIVATGLEFTVGYSSQNAGIAIGIMVIGVLSFAASVLLACVGAATNGHWGWVFALLFLTALATPLYALFGPPIVNKSPATCNSRCPYHGTFCVRTIGHTDLHTCQLWHTWQ